MIVGQIAVYLLGYICNIYYVGLSLNYSVLEQLKDIYLVFVLSVFMGFFIFQMSFITIYNIHLLLFIQIFSGVLSYFLLCYLFKVSIFMESVRYLKNLSSNNL